jgi:hypothetical protein
VAVAELLLVYSNLRVIEWGLKLILSTRKIVELPQTHKLKLMQEWRAAVVFQACYLSSIGDFTKLGVSEPWKESKYRLGVSGVQVGSR